MSKGRYPGIGGIIIAGKKVAENKALIAIKHYHFLECTSLADD